MLGRAYASPASVTHAHVGMTDSPCAAALQQGAAQAVAAHNQLLAGLIAGFPQSHSGASVLPFDFFDFFTEVLNNATASGIDVTTPCLSVPANEEFSNNREDFSPCPDPNQHVFWDSIHPAGWVHELAGQQLAELLGSMIASVS